MSKYGRFNLGSAYAATAPDGVALEDQADGELYRLRRELTALRATLADRETALGNAALDAQKAREQSLQGTQQAVSDAEQAWKADEAARFAQAEARWQQQAATVLAEAIARYEAAERELEQLRRDSARERTDASSGAAADEGELEQKRDEAVREPTPAVSAVSYAKRTHRKTKFEEFVSETASEGGSRTQDSRIVLRPDRVWAAEAAVEQRRLASSTKYAVAGAVGAASLGVLAIALYAGVLGHIPGDSDIPKANSFQATAVVVRDVNVRASPSTTAPIVSTLPHGVEVAMIEQRGNWTLVLTEGSSPRRGWVYRSFLKAE
jgi:Bacterial SH3 domain